MTSDARTVNEVTGTDIPSGAANPAGGAFPGERAGLLTRKSTRSHSPSQTLADSPNFAQKSHQAPGMRERKTPHSGRWGRVALMGIRRVDVTFVEVAFFAPTLLCAFAILWLLAYLPRSVRQDRMAEVRGLDDLDELGWKGWSQVKGWDPWTCWPECAGLHRKDWWRVYLSRTCWPGCQDLHREDWWRAYLDQRDSGQEQLTAPRPATNTPTGRAWITLSRYSQVRQRLWVR